MNKKEIEAVYEQYYRPMMIYALSLTKNRHDAEDLTEDTFIRAFLSYDGGMNIVGWLMAVMKNLFIDDFRRKRRYVCDGEVVLEWLASPQNVLEDYIRDEREIMILTAAGEMNDNQIAAMVALDVRHIRVIRHRVRKKLLAAAKEEGYL